MCFIAENLIVLCWVTAPTTLAALKPIVTFPAAEFLSQRWLEAKFRISVGFVLCIMLSFMLILGYSISFLQTTIFNLRLLKFIDYLDLQ